METSFCSVLVGEANARVEQETFLFGEVSLKHPGPGVPAQEVIPNGLDVSGVLEEGSDEENESRTGGADGGAVKENEKVVFDVLCSYHHDVWVD
jgi:hypothetical protein